MRARSTLIVLSLFTGVVIGAASQQRIEPSAFRGKDKTEAAKTLLEQARLQLSRAPRPLPTMRLNPAANDIFAFRYDDFALEGYEPHPHIKAEVAV